MRRVIPYGFPDCKVLGCLTAWDHTQTSRVMIAAIDETKKGRPNQ